MVYITLFLEFFKAGLFTIGGGLAMIPILEEAVIKHGWLTEAQFYDFVGICESTPGPIVVNVATYIGAVQGGILGSLAATLGVILPSFVIILLIASILKNFTDNKYFKGFLSGVKPVVSALIISTGIILLAKLVGYAAPMSFKFDLKSTIIFALVVAVNFVATKLMKKKLSSVLLIIISAALGIAVSCVAELL